MQEGWCSDRPSCAAQATYPLMHRLDLERAPPVVRVLRLDPAAPPGRYGQSGRFATTPSTPCSRATVETASSSATGGGVCARPLGAELLAEVLALSVVERRSGDNERPLETELAFVRADCRPRLNVSPNGKVRRCDLVEQPWRLALVVER